MKRRSGSKRKAPEEAWDSGAAIKLLELKSSLFVKTVGTEGDRGDTHDACDGEGDEGNAGDVVEVVKEGVSEACLFEDCEGSEGCEACAYPAKTLKKSAVIVEIERFLIPLGLSQ